MILETLFDRPRPARLAFPYLQNPPTLAFEGQSAAAITFHIRCELGKPKISSCPRHCGEWAVVTVPETPVDKECGPVPREHKVGAAGKLLDVKPEAKAKPVCDRADEKLRPGVLAADSAHHPAALFRTDDIHVLKASQGRGGRYLS